LNGWIIKNNISSKDMDTLQGAKNTFGLSSLLLIFDEGGLEI